MTPKRPRRLLILLAFASALAATLTAPSSATRQGATRGVTLVSIRVEDGSEVKLYEKSYALVIGASDYYAGWPKLPGVRRDIEEVSRALERHGFLVTKVENPDSAQLEKAFKEFIDTYGRGVDNRLLFYFAGHGHTVKQSYSEEMGYIVPVDAPNPNRDPDGFGSKALSMELVEVYAKRIQSKHALFVFDSCFSGSLFATSRAVPENIGYKTSRPVRQFITSGAADEQVPDKSVFREQFVAAIGGEADGNRDGYVTGTELGEFLQEKVVNYTKNIQHPQYGKIRNPNLDKGDFVFALAKAAPRPTPTPFAASPLAPDSSAAEVAFWNSIQNSADEEDFKDYLSRYPSGQFAGIARRRLSALEAAKARPTPTPAPSPAARPRQIQNRAGMEFVWIRPGSFMMGSASGDKDERPVHRVTIADGFYMGKYEVTQGQWQQVMGTTFRQQFDRAKADMALRTVVGEGAQYPIYWVNWNETQEFIERLNTRDDGYVYRLPSEAEWEYACRAETGSGYTGSVDSAAWYSANAGGTTHPVGQKQPNGFGLYDMLGNVWEWVQDCQHDDYKDAPTDGSAWLTGNQTLRVVRGGSYQMSTDINYFNRAGCNLMWRDSSYGFRVVAVARQ